MIVANCNFCELSVQLSYFCIVQFVWCIFFISFLFAFFFPILVCLFSFVFGNCQKDEQWTKLARYNTVRHNMRLVDLHDLRFCFNFNHSESCQLFWCLLVKWSWKKGITQLSHILWKLSVKYAWCTTLWQYSATTYGKNENRNCRLFEPGWERRNIYILQWLEKGSASICRFVNENLIANFIIGIRHTSLSDRRLDVSADFIVSRLAICIFGWFLLLDYPCVLHESFGFQN